MSNVLGRPLPRRINSNLSVALPAVGLPYSVGAGLSAEQLNEFSRRQEWLNQALNKGPKALFFTYSIWFRYHGSPDDWKLTEHEVKARTFSEAG